jgi:hypothetical protein
MGETGQELPAFGSDPIPQSNIYTGLASLQFAFKFIRRFIIGESASRCDEVKNLFMIIVMGDVTPNQLGILYYTSYVRSAWK